MAGLKIAAVLGLASFSLARAGCVAQTAAEAMTSLRTAKGCTNPSKAPTTGLCNCTIPTGAPQIACNAANRALWDGTGTPLKTWDRGDGGGAANRCVKVTPDQTAVAGKKHDFHYPSNYATECAQSGYEPGSYGCTWVKEAGKLMPHSFSHNSGYNQGWNSSAWCLSKFCWVDPCACDKMDIAKSSWLDGYYSYSKCGAVDTFTKGDCKGGTDNATCSAIPKCKWQKTALVAYASSVKIGIVSVLLFLSIAN